MVDQRDYRESVRMAMFEAMMDITGRLPPEIALQLLDLVVDMSDVPGREAMVARIRQINGQSDPDGEDDPEAQARREAQAKQQQADAELTQRERAAKIAKDEATAQGLTAKTARERLEAIMRSIEAGEKAAKKPELAPAADELLRSVEGA